MVAQFAVDHHALRSVEDGGHAPGRIAHFPFVQFEFGFLLGPRTFTFPAPSPSTLLLLGLCLQAAYFAVTWVEVGCTYGDRLLGLRVADDRGTRLGWGRSAVRAVLCTLVPVGLLWVLVSRDNRSVQDLLLRTLVLYD